MKIKILYLLIPIYFMIGCQGKNTLGLDPLDESFFNKTRFIMTSEEKEIYRHLPDHKSKTEFIIDFWKKRDPSPGTEENENKIEYEGRIQYANAHFRDKKIAGLGWDTDRGRILLHLGYPDEIDPITTTFRGTTKEVRLRVWYYDRFKLRLRFIDRSGFGEYKLEEIPTLLSHYLEKARNSLNLGNPKTWQSKFNFKLDYEKNQIIIRIPAEGIQFKNNRDLLQAEFKFSFTIYRNLRQMDSFSRKKSYSKPENEVLNTKHLQWSFPLVVKSPGKYYVEVIAEEVYSGAKYRKYIQFKKQ